MEEPKGRNASGRPQIYNGEVSDLARKMENRRRTDQELKSVHTHVSEEKPGEDRPVGKDVQGKKKPGQPKQAAPENASVSGKRKREQENERKMQILGGILGILIVLLIAALIYEVGLGHGTKKTRNEQVAAQQESERRATQKAEKRAKELARQQEAAAKKAEGNSADGESAQSEGNVRQTAAPTGDPLSQAKLKAAQYDYDGAIELLKSTEGYSENAEFTAAVSEFEQQKAACVPYPASEVTHIFFHTLIHDAAKAFDGDQYQDGYNQYMVTEGEFNSIIQQMYERGYVMVFLDEIVKKTEDSNGNKVFAEQDILLPPDRIPFVLSQDDVSYYHYMDGDGFASRLIVDENGDVKNEYIEDDGSVSVGDYDMVPLIDRFVEQHPDFSYHGQKGYVALTGYEGILGYRTDEVYKTKQEDRITFFQQQFFDSYPGGFDEAAFERECEGAKKVAEAMKANGWKFASHTWGHQNMHETNGVSYDKFMQDTDRWEAWVEPLIGETDTLIYAFGGDIKGAEP